jgi:vacuolar-type H+-ATPase subunit H
MHLTEMLDQLEELVAGAPYLPLTNRAVINQVACLDLVDKIRAALPSELAEAQRISRARERIVAQAETEAEDMRRVTRERLEQSAVESEAVLLAKVRADEILGEAEHQAREMAAAAVEYTSAVYSRIEEDLSGLLDELRARVPEELNVNSI